MTTKTSYLEKIKYRSQVKSRAETFEELKSLYFDESEKGAPFDDTPYIVDLNERFRNSFYRNILTVKHVGSSNIDFNKKELSKETYVDGYYNFANGEVIIRINSSDPSFSNAASIEERVTLLVNGVKRFAREHLGLVAYFKSESFEPDNFLDMDTRNGLNIESAVVKRIGNEQDLLDTIRVYADASIPNQE